MDYHIAFKHIMDSGKHGHLVVNDRLNRDLNKQVINKFHNKFSNLEECNVLDPKNSTDLCCLHPIHLPVMNKTYTEFVQTHNHLTISTENFSTPFQLFHLNYRLLQLQSSSKCGGMTLHEGLDSN